MAGSLSLTNPAYGTGKFGQSRTSGRIDVPADAWAFNSSSPRTVEWWFQTTSGSLQVMSGQFAGGVNWYCATSGNVVRLSDGGNLDYAASANNGSWHHCAVTFTSGATLLHVDGIYAGSVNVRTGGGSAMTMAYYNNSYDFSGALDEVAIWSVARYAANTNFSPPTSSYGGSEANLVALYHLDGDGTNAAGGSTAATTYTLTGPASGASGVASSNFTITASGSLASAVGITPSDAGGGGTFTPTTVTLATGSSSTATFTYTPGAPGTKTITTTNNGGLTNPASIPYTASSPSVVVAANNASIFQSPCCWNWDGTSLNTNQSGAYLKFQFSGTSLAMDTVALSGLSDDYPRARITVDTNPSTEFTLSSGTTSFALASGLASGTHTAVLELLASSPQTDRWGLAAALKVKDFVIDGGATISAATLRSKRLIWYGDSISETFRALGNGNVTGMDASQSVCALLARALDAEYGLIAYTGQGFNATGNGGIPTFAANWDKFSSGVSRLSAGTFRDAPDYVFCWHGTNGSVAQSDVAAMIANFLAAAPAATMIGMVVPPGGFARGAITAAVNTAVSTRVKVFDFASDAGLNSYGAATSRSIDGYHPTTREHALLASKLVAMVSAAMASTASTVQRGFRSAFRF